MECPSLGLVLGVMANKASIFIPVRLAYGKE